MGQKQRSKKEIGINMCIQIHLHKYHWDTCHSPSPCTVRGNRILRYFECNYLQKIEERLRERERGERGRGRRKEKRRRKGKERKGEGEGRRRNSNCMP